ncbi:MAG: hypothetical protein DMG13_14255 [Acidobacteria bacterium]|nr:MAG: hypothetical protein DMG13_14255 [Acidobacteriota bacterium]
MSHGILEKRTARLFAVIVAAFLIPAPVPIHTQRGGRGGPAPPAREAAAADLTGDWVSVITEDWKLRMVTPKKGVSETLPLNAEGRRMADTWDPARDEASGEQCRSYGAAAIMRVPGRLHITWQDANTLRIDTDAGTQTRLFHFGAAAAPTGEPAWQGYSVAQWEYAPGARGSGQPRMGSLKAVTTNMRPGYVRKNGAPYSKNAVVTEYYDHNTLPNGDQWLTVTTRVEDPVYFSRPYLTSSDFKKLPDASGWNPTPCLAR